ncbi:MAG: hypothetical protein PHV74_10310 [Dehalococcoidia bacterium]|nr:hypothetical protein [Dehalococcoidia bacterium]
MGNNYSISHRNEPSAQAIKAIQEAHAAGVVARIAKLTESSKREVGKCPDQK